MGADGLPHFVDRVPYRYRDFPDNRVHVVKPADKLMHLAAVHFAPMTRACGYWWILADFQPQPIIDPILPLYKQRDRVVVPSRRVLTDVILPSMWRRS